MQVNKENKFFGMENNKICLGFSDKKRRWKFSWFKRLWSSKNWSFWIWKLKIS